MATADGLLITIVNLDTTTNEIWPTACQFRTVPAPKLARNAAPGFQSRDEMESMGLSYI